MTPKASTSSMDIAPKAFKQLSGLERSDRKK
jgi:hypothetical protein